MFVGHAINEYGTLMSAHICDTCDTAFTVCPPTTEKVWGGNCLAPSCGSYDEKRDADKFFDDPAINIEREHIADTLKN